MIINHLLPNKLFVIILCVIVALSGLSGCLSSRSNSQIPTPTKATENPATSDQSTSYSDSGYRLNKGSQFSFATEDNSPTVTISEEAREKLLSYMDSIKIEYVYEELYDTDNAYKRMTSSDYVTKHKYNALDNSGKLTVEHLAEIVKANNALFFESVDDTKKAFFENVEDDKLDEICAVIIESIEKLLDLYPDIDKDRVYCNFGYLKVLYTKAGMSFAAIDQEGILKINRNIMKTAVLLQGDGNEEKDILIHEAMHLVQRGCQCENIPHCTQRVGISKLYDDDRYNSAYFVPLFEGSAEKSMSNITGDKESTYTTYIGYIDSLDLCAAIDPELYPTYFESISFYDKPQMLFDAFHCNSKEDEYDAMKVLMTINYFQNMPEEWMKDINQKYGLDTSDEEILTVYHRTIKPDIVLAISKLYYQNLINCLFDSEVTQNDLLFLIAILEARIDKHLTVHDPERDKYNDRFLTTYTEIRKTLFDVISDENGINFEKIYNTYKIVSDKDGNVNASLLYMTEENKAFLIKQMYNLTNNLLVKIK